MRAPLPCVVRASFLVLFAGLSQPLLADPVLSQHNDSLTTYNASATTVQKVKPLYQQRGSDLEGGARMRGAPGPMLPAFSSGYSAGMLGGIDLATLTWAQGDVDMALPTDGPSVVIGRTFNHRQGTGAAITVSDGPQGANWFQSAMPELAFFAGASDDLDIVHVVLGAGRFLEYKRAVSKGTEFVGVNGASGVIKAVPGSGGSTPYPTLELTDAAGTVWVFWDASASHIADWQLWKKTDSAGRTAYVGSKTTHSTAVADYNGDGTVKKIYQEYGTAGDERRYTFTYGTTIGGVARLTEVKAETKTGGAWTGTPTGVVEVGRVSYDYYTTATATTGDAADSHGDAADLKTVKIRTPLTDSGSTLGSGVFDERSKYYRYYKDAYNGGDPDSLGHPHALKLILGFEGTRRYDWPSDSTFDDDFAGATIGTGSLTSYADAFFTYESSNTTQRIATAFFNGECGCVGGSSAGTYTFTPSTNGSFTPSTGYTAGWLTRTVVKLPDNSYQTRYFDEVGQPLSSVVSDINPGTGGALYWVTGIDRNGAGRVTAIHSPANLASGGYNHSTGGITYDTSLGLVTLIDRYTTGEPSYDAELEGLVSGMRFRTGTTGGSQTYTSKSILSKRAITVGGATVVRPLVSESRAFHTAATGYATSSTYDATTYTYDWWETNVLNNTFPLYITLKSVTTTLPAVTTAKHGANTTHDAVTYLRKDGRTAFSVAPDGIYTAMKYNSLGLPVRTVRDADPNVSGDFDTGYGPGNYGLSTSSNSGLTYASEATYDAVGRIVTTTAHAGSSPLVSYMYYSRLADNRLATIASPLYASGVPSWTGPFSYQVNNQGGRGEFSATLGPSSAVTTALASWIDETDADPIDALHSTLEGSSRAFVQNVSTTIYDTPGVKVTESRRYVDLIGSSAWTGTAGTHYDRTQYSYDDMGRTIRVKDATDTIDRTVYDAIGRPMATWTGLNDSTWTASSGNVVGGGSTDDMTQTSAVAYDGATVASTLAVGNGHVTTRVAYVEGAASGFGTSGTRRESTMYYDVRGNLIATRSPQAPHIVNAYDVRRRVIASAFYSATGGVDETADAANDATLASGATIRLGLSETSYDERGRVYKTVNHKITQSTGVSADSLESLTWYDSVGRTIKTGGTNLSKTLYDRLGRSTHSFTLARCNDSSYSDVLNSVAGDIVLEESQTVYDDADETGLVLMSGTIIRNYSDTSTTGALDSNADSDRNIFTAANLAGRLCASAVWYDSLDRPVDSVAYGTNGGSNLNRTGLSLPTRGLNTPLRTTTAYDAWGRVDTIEQPKEKGSNVGYKTKYLYDDASRKIAEIGNYTPSPANLATPLRDNDLYTRYEYANGLLSAQWVDINGDGYKDINWGTGSTPNYPTSNFDQVTYYLYNADKSVGSGTHPDSKVASKRLLTQVKYPPQNDVDTADADISEYSAFSAQGQVIATWDQNGTKMGKTYDTGGRLTVDTATATGTGIDTAVLRAETVYDSRGMVSTVTQYDATSSGNALDQVKNSYDDWGNLQTFQQDYNGTVAGSSGDDLGVTYNYSKVNDTSSAGGKRRSGIRVTGMKLERSAGATTVQDTRHTFSNSSSYDDDIGRVTTITDSGGSTTFADYRYGGTGMVVSTKLSVPSISYELATSGTSGYNTFLDQFGRVIKSRWRNTSTGAIWYDSNPAYDDNSNITKVDNAWVTPFGAIYQPDGVNRLEKETIGTILTGSIAPADTVRTEDWTISSSKLSQTGNWPAYKTTRNNVGGTLTVEYDQTRTETGRNEIVKITDSVGTQQPEYSVDKKGNATDDKIGLGSYGYKYKYDAWNRLVKTTDKAGTTTVTEYRYNGLGHRIGWKARFDTGKTYANNLWRYFQYNPKWQQVGMYVESSAGANTVGSNAIETYLYDTAGLDGRGGSSYIDRTIFRDRDVNGGATGDGTREERRFYLQNWRNDVVGLVNSGAEVIERYRYDAYGRPESYSSADLTGNAGGPNGVVSGADFTQFSAVWSVGGPVTWQTDISDNSGSLGPDGATDNGDSVAYTTYYFAGSTGGIGLMSGTGIGNRKGLAGYEFDPILAGNGSPNGTAVPVYHVRNRALNSYAGKWLQKDPLQYHDGMNLYEYGKNDPLDVSDPLGLCGCSAGSFAAQEAPRQPAGRPPTGRPPTVRPPASEICRHPCKVYCDDYPNSYGGVICANNVLYICVCRSKPLPYDSPGLVLPPAYRDAFYDCVYQQEKDIAEGYKCPDNPPCPLGTTCPAVPKIDVRTTICIKASALEAAAACLESKLECPTVPMPNGPDGKPQQGPDAPEANCLRHKLLMIAIVKCRAQFYRAKCSAGSQTVPTQAEEDAAIARCVQQQHPEWFE